MRIVFTSYVRSLSFTQPQAWLDRIKGWVGVLEELAVTNEVISIEQINYVGKYVNNGVEYRFITSKNNLFPSELHNYIKGLEPDAVFVHGMHFPLQVIQLNRKLGNRVKIFLQNHAERPAEGWKRLFQKLADHRVTGYFFTSSELGLPWVEKGIISRQSKIHEVMEASSAFREMQKELSRKITGAEGNPLFLWVGRLDANKDPLTVITAFIKFISHRPDATLYMFFHTEELKAEIVKQIEPFRKNIILLGKIPHEELQPWFSSADFFISASHYEGGGIAVCEGMSCGCIPLLTNIDSFRVMTNKGKCGRLYEPGNSDQLLSLLIETESMSIDLERKKVIEQFKNNLSFQAIAGKIDQVLVAS